MILAKWRRRNDVVCAGRVSYGVPRQMRTTASCLTNLLFCFFFIPTVHTYPIPTQASYLLSPQRRTENGMELGVVNSVLHPPNNHNPIYAVLSSDFSSAATQHNNTIQHNTTSLNPKTRVVTFEYVGVRVREPHGHHVWTEPESAFAREGLAAGVPLRVALEGERAGRFLLDVTCCIGADGCGGGSDSGSCSGGRCGGDDVANKVVSSALLSSVVTRGLSYEHRILMCRF